MARRSRRRRYSILSEDEGLNLTPLLDVIFNLIFFFILATTIRSDETFFDLVLPKASEAAPQEFQEEVPEILVMKGGEFMFGGRVVSDAELRTMLEDLVENKKVSKAIVSADAEAMVQHTVAVMDILREAGITQMTQRVAAKRE